MFEQFLQQKSQCGGQIARMVVYPLKLSANFQEFQRSLRVYAQMKCLIAS